jgi:hypothetical protein
MAQDAAAGLSHWRTQAVLTSAAGGSTVPVTYMGCDGGLAVSDGIATPAVDTNTAPPDWDQGLTYTDTGAWQNYNHGLPSVACYQFASDPDVQRQVNAEYALYRKNGGTLGGRVARATEPRTQSAP